MQKYKLFFNIYWSNMLTYRVSWLLWRLRQFLVSFIALSLWTAVYEGSGSAFGYQRPELFSYIFYTTVLQNIVLSTSLTRLGNVIYSGELSNILTKPVRILGQLIAQDSADKLLNVLSSLVEFLLLWLIFKPELLTPDPAILPLFIITAVLGLIISFSIQIIFGSIGFWSPDTWGPRFLFYILIDLTSGKLFPLDILPATFQKILHLTPFPYLTYTQIQLVLGRKNPDDLLLPIVGLLIWTVVIVVSARALWRRGMRQYQAAGQ